MYKYFYSYKLDKALKIVSGGSVINRGLPSLVYETLKFFGHVL